MVLEQKTGIFFTFLKFYITLLFLLALNWVVKCLFKKPILHQMVLEQNIGFIYFYFWWLNICKNAYFCPNYAGTKGEFNLI